MGSSPRMRGSLMSFFTVSLSGGIIPAHAGLTQKSYQGNEGAWDHPRACGAHNLEARSMRSCLGSSPRMRGSLLSEEGWFGDVGIIPAHAGLTTKNQEFPYHSWDHPRACGAHTKKSQY